MNNIEQHKLICEELTETYKYKNMRYGNSFGDTVQKYGMIAALTRMSDKFNRIEHNILYSEVEDSEKLRDNCLDLANYLIMTIMETDKENRI